MRAQIVDRDEGCRTGAHIVLGWEGKRKPALAALQAFESGLATVFAGFLKTPARGRWYASEESCLAYDFTSELSRGDVVARVERLLTLHGGGLSVQWVHIETRDVHGHHVKLEPAPRLSDTVDEYASRWPRSDRTRDEVLRAAHDTPAKFRRDGQ